MKRPAIAGRLFVSELRSLDDVCCRQRTIKPDDIARMISVDGVISDRPDLLRGIATDKGVVPPSGRPLKPAFPE